MYEISSFFSAILEEFDDVNGNKKYLEDTKFPKCAHYIYLTMAGFNGSTWLL